MTVKNLAMNTRDILTTLTPDDNSDGIALDQIIPQQQITYDEFNRIIRVQTNNSTANYAYDELDRLVRVIRINQNNSTTTFTRDYDESGRVIRILREPDDSNMTFFMPNDRIEEIYDEFARVIRRETNDRTLNFTYDEFGRLISKERIVHTTTQHSSINYTYNESDLLEREVQMDNGFPIMTCTYEYNEAGRLVRSVHINDGSPIMSFTYEYNEAGRLVRNVHINDGSPIMSFTYEYNEAGRLIRTQIEQDINPQRTEIIYDEFSRVIRKQEDNSTTNYTYDDHGRLIRKQRDNSTINYTYDELDRIIRKQTDSIIEDYHYNEFDILVRKIRTEPNFITATCVYDEAGQIRSYSETNHRNFIHTDYAGNRVQNSETTTDESLSQSPPPENDDVFEINEEEVADYPKTCTRRYTPN